MNLTEIACTQSVSLPFKIFLFSTSEKLRNNEKRMRIDEIQNNLKGISYDETPKFHLPTFSAY